MDGRGRGAESPSVAGLCACSGDIGGEAAALLRSCASALARKFAIGESLAGDVDGDAADEDDDAFDDEEDDEKE